MPLRKNNVGSQAGLGENLQQKVRVDHVSMHTEGTKWSKEVRQPCNMDLVAIIEDLQCSQATMWAEFQSFCQMTSTPQTPCGSQGP